MKSDWKNESTIVLDACALIAFLNDEPGADVVAALLQEVPSVELSALNLLEVAYDAVRSTGQPSSAREILDAIRSLPVRIRWGLDEELIESASRLKTTFRISLADSVAVALAASLNAPLATSDHHEFTPLETVGTARFLWIR